MSNWGMTGRIGKDVERRDGGVFQEHIPKFYYSN
jgi:hypothetical protein